MNVGVIGAGRQGKRRVSVLRQFPDHRLVAVADTNLDAARALAQEWGAQAVDCWRAVVDASTVDVVVVSVPPADHAPIAIAAVEAGKPVLIEKPLARTLDESEAILQAAARRGVVVKCGFNLRFHPGIRKAHDLAVNGDLGTLTFMRCRYGIGGRAGYDQEWRAFPGIAGGGELMDRGTHVVDLFRWFMGDFAEASAMIASFYWKFQGGMEDNAFGLLRTPRGQIAAFHVSATQWRHLFSLEVFGTEGYALVNGLGYVYGPEALAVGRRNDDGSAFVEEVTEFVGDDRSWAEEWLEFVSAIREHRQPLGNGEDGLEALRLVAALYESGQTGRTVLLPADPGVPLRAGASHCGTQVHAPKA